MGLDIKYGVSTWLWTSPFTTESAEELFPKISQMGFDAIKSYAANLFNKMNEVLSHF